MSHTVPCQRPSWSYNELPCLIFPPLHHAIAQRKIKEVSSYLYYQASPNALGPGATTPLHVALFGQQLYSKRPTALLERISALFRSHQDAFIELLRLYGAKTTTPLEQHFAPLLELYFPDTTATDRLRQVLQHNPSAALIAHLIRQGASLYDVDAAGVSPLDLLVDRPDLVRTLCQRNAIGLDEKSPHRGTLMIHLAASKPQLATLRVLLEMGMPPSPRNKDHLTPLLLTRSPEGVKLLLAHGAIPTERDAQGRSLYELCHDQPEILAVLPKRSHRSLTLGGYFNVSTL